jgi:hypothetical protein
MASRIDEAFLDLSGYTPSSDDISDLKRKLRSGHTLSLPNALWADTESDLMLSHKQGHPDEHPTLQLSLDDLRELEEAFNHFNCENVPLTADRILTDI